MWNNVNSFFQVRIKEQPFKQKKKGLGAKRTRRAGDEDEAEEEKKREEQQAENEEEEEEEETKPAEDPLASFTQQQLTEAVVELLLPGETVAAALRRLGGLGGRKKGKQREESKPTEETKRDAEKLDRLTALADRLVGSGMFEIYQQTYEKLAYMMKRSAMRQKPTGGDDDNEEDELDMFGDKFDERHGGKSEDKEEETKIGYLVFFFLYASHFQYHNLILIINTILPFCSDWWSDVGVQVGHWW